MLWRVLNSPLRLQDFGNLKNFSVRFLYVECQHGIVLLHLKYAI